MTLFDDAMSMAADVFYGSDFAESLTYNGEPIPGHIDREGASAGSAVRGLSGRAHVRKSDIPEPAYRDSIVESDGTTWRVIPPIPVDSSPVDWVLAVEADARPIPRP